ncbi:single-stranded DNA-binding protein [Comamonas kerstersii]
MTTAVPAAPVAARKIKPMEVFVVGRIDATVLNKGRRYTQIVTPAPDAYSHPQVIEIRSKEKLGSVGEEVQVFGILGGYKRKPFKVTDPETGEVRLVTPVDMTLDHAE